MDSISSSGRQGKAPKESFLDVTDISADGRYVAFTSFGSNLVANDTNGASDVFVHDRKTGKTQRVSIGNRGQEGIGSALFGAQDFGVQSWGPSMSADGRYVAFVSYAVNFVTADTNFSSDVFVRDLVHGTTTRVSESSSGAEAQPNFGPTLENPEHLSGSPYLSSNGRYITFTSEANNLAEGDTNGMADIFLHDASTGKTEKISTVEIPENPVLRDSGLWGGECSAVSDNGRFVSFTYNVGPSNAAQVGAFVHDRKTQETSLASVGIDGGGSEFEPWAQWELNGVTYTCGAFASPISANGRYSVFATEAYNLVPSDDNDSLDVFLRDRKTERTRRVSVSSSGGEADADSVPTSITPDGRFITFISESSNLDPTDRPLRPQSICSPCPGNLEWATHMDVFVFDALIGTTDLISITEDGTTTDPEEESTDTFLTGNVASAGGALSKDGRFVSFESTAPNMVSGDGNAVPVPEEEEGSGCVVNSGICSGAYGGGKDTFVRHRGTALGTAAWGMAAKHNGRPSVVAARDAIDDLSTQLTEMGANLRAGTIAYRPRSRDLFLRAELEDMPAAGSARSMDPMLYGIDFSANGRQYQARAQRIVSGSITGAGKTSLGLFTTNDLGLSWTKVAPLEGGIGTTGKEFSLVVPLGHLGADTVVRLGGARLFSALGTYESGPVRVYDRLGIITGAGNQASLTPPMQAI